MKTLLMILAMLMLSVGLALAGETAPSYAERTAIAIAQNNAEIERKHQLNMEIAKAETLRAEKELERDIYSFNVSASSYSENNNVLTDEA